MARSIKAVVEAIRRPGVLTQDLLEKRYRGRINRFEGYCYVAAEAAQHLLGGRKAGWRLMVIPRKYVDGLSTHWYTRNIRTGEVADPTAPQFEGEQIRYDKGRPGHGGKTGPNRFAPSKRAQEVIRRVNGS